MTTDDILNDLVASNKAAAIRKALRMMPTEAKPADIAEYIKREHNIDVTPDYVSVVMAQSMKKTNSNFYEAIRLARKLVKEAGSYSGARNAIDAVAEEQERTTSISHIYKKRLTEIDLRLEDSERPIDHKDKRELMTEKKRIQKLLDALNEF